VLASQRSTCINCVIGNKETYHGGDSNEGRHGQHRVLSKLSLGILNFDVCNLRCLDVEGGGRLLEAACLVILGKKWPIFSSKSRGWAIIRVWAIIRIITVFVFIISGLSLNMVGVGLKSRSLGQILEKSC